MTWYVMFSGGKDSLAALLKASEQVPRDKLVVVYVEVTGNTHPENKRYVKQVVEELGLKLITHKREIDFYDMMVRYGIPTHRNRWCWKEYKAKFIEKYSRVIVGVKAADSRSRAKRWTAEKQVINGQYVWSPIWNWSTEQVLDYIRERGFEICPLYRVFGDSGNCVFCPFKRKDQIRRIMQFSGFREKICDTLKKIRGDIRVKHVWLQWCNQVTLQLFQKNTKY